MNEEKKVKSKIREFEIPPENPDDPEMDEFLRKSVIEEADALEAKLNSDPNLLGVGASDDLFLSIVGKLKEQGIWEEDETEMAASEETESGAIAAQDVREAESEEKVTRDVREGEAEEIMPREVCEGEAEEIVPREVCEGKAEEIVARDECETESENGEIRDESLKTSQISVQDQVPDKNKSVEKADMDAKTDKVQRVNQQEECQNPYPMLSENEQKALKLGLQIQEKKARKALRRKKWSKVYKGAGVAAALLVLVCGVGMSTEANRKIVRQTWDNIMVSLGFTASMDYVDSDYTVRSTMKEELAVMEDIKNEIGIPGVEFIYLPNEMKFLKYECNTEVGAILFYSYNDKIISVKMINTDEEGVLYFSLDNNTVKRDIVTIQPNIQATIWETNLNASEETHTYTAELEYENAQYIINGDIPMEELKKMLEFLIFL